MAYRIGYWVAFKGLRVSKQQNRLPRRGVYFLNLSTVNGERSTVTGQPVKQAEEHNMILC
jgi:hypothetical protein